MAVITIFPTYDGDIGASTTNWNTLITADTAKGFNDSGTSGGGSGFGGGESVSAAADANGTSYQHRQMFLEFDLETIQDYFNQNIGTSIVSAYIELSVRGAEGGPKVKLRKGNWNSVGGPATGWFNDYTSTLYYDGADFILLAGQTVQFPVSSTGLSDLALADPFKVMVIESDYVHAGDTPTNGDANVANFYYSEITTVTLRPSLVVTVTDPSPGLKGINLTNGTISLNSGKITIQ